MGKKLGGAGGVVMVAAVNGVVWVPWIVVGTLAALVLVLVFVALLAFSDPDREAPTRRVIALIGAVKSPRSPPARRNHKRAKPPDQP